MAKLDPSTVSNSDSEPATAQVVNRFIRAFDERDAAAFVELVADDCIMESIQPAPNGTRYEGYETNLRFWQAMATDPNGSFEVEDLFVCGDRAVQRWRYQFGDGEDNSVRGVTLIRVRHGKIVEALAYAKTPAQTTLGQDQS